MLLLYVLREISAYRTKVVIGVVICPISYSDKV